MLLSKERNSIPGLAACRQTSLRLNMPAIPVATTASCKFYVHNTSCVDMKLAWQTRLLDAAARILSLDLGICGKGRSSKLDFDGKAYPPLQLEHNGSENGSAQIQQADSSLRENIVAEGQTQASS